MNMFLSISTIEVEKIVIFKFLDYNNDSTNQGTQVCGTQVNFSGSEISNLKSLLCAYEAF